jgi:hypothetical protein
MPPPPTGAGLAQGRGIISFDIGFPLKTRTIPAATGTQNGNFEDISILNRPLQELLMGVETPIPPKMINGFWG